MNKILVGVKELAEILGRKKSWVYGKCRTGEIIFYKIGKYNMFDVDEVMEWVERQRAVA